MFVAAPRVAGHLSAFNEAVALIEGLRWLSSLKVSSMEAGGENAGGLGEARRRLTDVGDIDVLDWKRLPSGACRIFGHDGARSYEHVGRRTFGVSHVSLYRGLRTLPRRIEDTMPSLNYQTEKLAFRHFYDSSRETMDGAKSAFMTLIRSLIATDPTVAGAKVDGRIKEREECLGKFRRKYRTRLESDKKEYAIRDHITDLIGLRVVCFYEDEVERIRSLISDEFEVLGVTDKTAKMEESDNAFGYKGLHMDLSLSDGRKKMKEYAAYADFPFELQIRTVVQDSRSVLDHRIKYKKSIPNDLKRRINTLAALFELADREFRAIRDGTAQALAIAEPYAAIEAETAPDEGETAVIDAGRSARRYTPLDAFSLLRIARHFFHNEDFEAHKIDGFTQEVAGLEPGISRGKFNYYLREHIGEVRRYQTHFETRPEGGTMNSFTVMRHCLYAGNAQHFSSMLTDRAREAFDEWRFTQTTGVRAV